MNNHQNYYVYVFRIFAGGGGGQELENNETHTGTVLKRTGETAELYVSDEKGKTVLSCITTWSSNTADVMFVNRTESHASFVRGMFVKHELFTI
jgi:hypothetical protein